MKLLILLGIIIFLLATISAVEINLTSGDSYTFDLGVVYDYYSIVGNSSEINISVNQKETMVTISIGKYFLSNTFEILFFKENQIIHSYGSGGSSGSGSSYKVNKTILYPNCDFGAKRCFDKELWSCYNGNWAHSQDCACKCEEGRCIPCLETPEELLILASGLFSLGILLIFLVVLGSVVILLIIYYTLFSKRHTPKGNERRLKRK